MAIQHNIAEGASEFGIAFNNAYYRIITASIQRQSDDDPKFQVMLDLAAYATSTPTPTTRQVDFKRFFAPWDDVHAQNGDSFIDKAYNYVMAQSEMAGSTAA